MRIRQIVFAAHDLARAAGTLAAVFALDAPYRDPAVAEFGLDNAVFVFGDQFIEVVSPVRVNTAAGRLLDRRGDSGYMLILQTADFDAARARLQAHGVRTVWDKTLPDIRAMHLHPKDVGGAIVSIDQPVPPEAWRWGGPAWRKQPDARGEQRVLGVQVDAADPPAMCARWSQVLGLPQADATCLTLDQGGRIDFVAAGPRGEGIGGYTLAVADRAAVLSEARARGLRADDASFDLFGTRIGVRDLAHADRPPRRAESTPPEMATRAAAPAGTARIGS